MGKKRKLSRIVWGCLLLSVLLHLFGLYMVRDLWLDALETEAFRSRLASIPPLFKPRRLNTVQKQVDLPELGVELEYIASEQQAAELREQDLQQQAEPEKIEEQLAPLALREIASGAKEDAPILERVKMLSPSELGLADSMGIPSMDLLRIVDMARANKDHAAVIIDPSSRRDLMGYVNFTQLRVYGAGSGRGVLDALTRYLRDNSRILAQVRAESYDYFLSENLLKDPVHFLLEGGGMPAYRDEVMTQFSREEKDMLERYLRGGGFLFIEGSNRYLREMRSHLRSILGSEATLLPVPLSHPLYHAFYDFGGGFPGEDKARATKMEDNPTWYYPTQAFDEQPAAEQIAFFNPNAADGGEAEEPPRQGIWGVEMDGQLVAILSDMGLHQNWGLSFNAEAAGDEPVLYSLMAGANIVAYALTRDGGRTPKLPPPAWMQKLPVAKMQTPLDEPERMVERAMVDGDIFSALDASLAIVQAPLGSAIEGEIQLRLDGRYSLELLKTGYNGILLHNLPAGEHWIELRYGEQTQQLEFNLQGGRILTLNFALNRFAFMTQLRLGQQDEQVSLGQWNKAFSDLEIEEIYLAEDREWLEHLGSLSESE